MSLELLMTKTILPQKNHLKYLLLLSLDEILKLYKLTKIRVDMDHRSLFTRKPVLRFSDKIRHKPACVAMEDGQRLELLDLEIKYRNDPKFSDR